MDESRLAAILDALAAQPGIPHAVMAVERTDGSFRWAAARGTANDAGTPMQVETPFYIASIDKLFTAVATLKLQEQGLIDIDLPLSTWLPADILTGLHRVGGADYTTLLTPRHLLGHTSGLASYVEDAPAGGRSLVERLVHEGDRSWTLEEALADVRERLAGHFPPQPRQAAKPRIRYSDTNYLLLVALIEAVTRDTVHRVFTRMIFEPAGMRRTWMPGWNTPADAGMDAAHLWFGERTIHIPLALSALPSVISTVDDLLRFMRTFVAGSLFAAVETGALMRARFNRFGPPLDRAALRAPSWPIQYGLGLMRFQLPRLFTGFRRLPAVYGHTGSTGTWLFHCPDLDLLLAGSVGQATAGAVPYRVVPRILRAALG